MSTGQMIEDVKLALEGKGHVHFYGRPGGVIPTPVELSRIISAITTSRSGGRSDEEGLRPDLSV